MFNKPATGQNLPEVLVVDDTPANLQVLTEILQTNGYKVHPFLGGAPALQAAKTSPPDLILLDLQMPDMNGYELCQHLKEDETLKHIPIIFISGLGETENKVKALQCGGVDYITKPFKIAEVLARVKIHLHLRQLQLELAKQNAQLEETVRLRTREITEARDQLAKARDRLAILGKAKSDFLSLISHELRTPLSGLLGIAELILDEGSDLPSMVSLNKHFQRCRAKMLTIVDDALLLTQIDVDAEKFAHAPTSLNSALSRAAAHTNAFAESSHVSIGELPVFPEMVAGEAEVLGKALEALLETGIRFSKPGSVMSISGSASIDGVMVMIETTGLTIPEEFIPRFFDVLAIGDAIIPGGDLGLRPAVAERIISLFGGSVTVENLDPAGIRLNVYLKAGSREL